jgi:hypothetical protein
MKPFVAKLIASGFGVLACMALLTALVSVVVLLRRQPKAATETEPHWTGHGIDVTGITPRLRRLRSGFRSLISSKTDEAQRRRHNLELKRRELARLGYFRNRPETIAPEATETHTG